MPWVPADEDDFPSLGYGVVSWVESLGLIVPAGAKIGEVFRFSEDQFRDIVEFYELKPDGSRLHSRGQIEGVKGVGKSPTAAAIALAEYDGPVVFSHWDEDGQPVGVRRDDAVVGIFGVAEEQTGNLFDWLYSAIPPEVCDLRGWDLNLNMIRRQKGGYGSIECATSGKSATGRPYTFVVKEESWLWTRTSGGHRLSQQLNADTAKTLGSTLEVTNPPILGQNSVAEMSRKQAAAGNMWRSAPVVDAPQDMTAASVKLKKNRKLIIGLMEQAYGAASAARGGWIDVPALYERVISDEELDGSMIMRLYAGVCLKEVGRLVDPVQWKAHYLPGASLVEGEPVVLGFDGSKSVDATALVACQPSSMHCELVGFWERPLGVEEWAVPEAEVTATVAKMREKYGIALIAADLAGGWDLIVRDWGQEFSTVTAADVESQFTAGRVWSFYWNNSNRVVDRVTRALQATLDADSPQFSHADQPDLNRHVLNMTLEERSNLRRPGKDSSRSMIHQTDAGIAFMLALHGAQLQRRLSHRGGQGKRQSAASKAMEAVSGGKSKNRAARMAELLS